MITAVFFKLALFKDVSENNIIDSFNVNTTPVLRLRYRFYGKLEVQDDFYCGVMVSIADFMSSPFFSVYGTTKAALKIFIESVNVELEKEGTTNQISMSHWTASRTLVSIKTPPTSSRQKDRYGRFTAHRTEK